MPVAAADIAALSRLLDEALELDGSEREAWLAALPPDAQRHASALRDMLAAPANSDPDNRLSSLPKLGNNETTAHPGERVGAYSLIREIGRGGMGSVWLAARADGSFKREVALKLPHLAWGSGLAERMAREREIGALLEHPNIARLYEAGVDERGRPFIAMELIDGQPIDAWCAKQELDVRARLRLFVQVVRAVSYAHGRLVIHRDLKPANVLIDVKGQAHLLDFGIAKLIDDAAGPSLTQEQGRMWTPRYAAPEQIEGKPVGVAADVYSMGVMLYELLTGAMALIPKRSSMGAIEEAILQGDVPLANSRVQDRATQRALRGDVDAILAKAMKLEPLQRYASADALAEDIERHLAGDTVKAQPDSTSYRLRKAVVRHRFGFAATAAVLLAVLAGGGVALLQARRAAQQADRARLATEFVTEVFRASSRNGAPSGPTGEKAEPLLDHGARLIETRFAGQPDMQADLYGVVGKIYADLGANKLAINYATRQIAMLRQGIGDPAARVGAMLLLADAHFQEGQLAEAQRAAQQAIVWAGRQDQLLLESIAALGNYQLASGQIDEARASALAAENTATRISMPSVGKARCWELRAGLLERQNRFDEARPYLDHAIDEAVRAEGSLSLTAVRVQIHLAYSLGTAPGRLVEAESIMSAALQTLTARGGTDNLRSALEGAAYAVHLLETGVRPYEQVRAVVERSRLSIERQRPDVPPIVRARFELLLSKIHFSRDELVEAERLLKASSPILRASSDNLDLHRRLAFGAAWLAMAMGHHGEADGLWRQVLEFRRQLGTATMPSAAETWGFAARNLSMGGAHDRAESLLDEAPQFGALAGDPYGAAWPKLLPAVRARVRLDRGDIAGAQRVLPVLDQTLATAMLQPGWWFFGELFGEMKCVTGHPEAGLTLLLRTIRGLDELIPGNNGLGTARLNAVAGLCALSLGDVTEAQKLAARARLAFTVQPHVSPYFKAPLVKLEHALKTRRRPA